jgi:hypothetical protein
MQGLIQHLIQPWEERELEYTLIPCKKKMGKMF